MGRREVRRMLVTPKRAARPAWLIPVAMGGVLVLGIGIGVAIGLGVFSSPKLPTTPAVVIGEPPPPAPVQQAVRPQDEEAPPVNAAGEEDEALVPPPPLRPDPNAPEQREARSYALEADDNNVPTAVEPVPVARPAAPQLASPQMASLVPVPPQSVKPPPGSPPWIRNAVATPRGAAAGHPMIAVMLDDVGVDRKGAEKAILLKAPMTLSFMTYAEDLPRMTAAARAHGHELMVHVPMQPMGDHLDAGPQVLTTNLSAEEIRRRLDWGLSRFDGYVGINNHMGSRFTADAAGMNVVMAEMKRRGLLFVDSVTTGHSAAPEMAHRYGVPFASRNVFLDNEQSVDAIRVQLAQVEAYARKHGAAIAIGHPHETTIEALHGWLGSLEAKGFVLVPVTTIVKASQ